jgi:hypothetical protein
MIMNRWRRGRPAAQTGGVAVLATVDLGSSVAVMRRAEAGDVPAIVDLLAADQLGATRDGVRFYGRLGFAATHEGMKLRL